MAYKWLYNKGVDFFLIINIMYTTFEFTQMILEHANFFILRFEEIKIATGIDFFTLYMTVQAIAVLPPIIDFLTSSPEVQLEIAQLILANLDLTQLVLGDLNLVNNVATTSTSILNSVNPQSLTPFVNSASNIAETTTEVFLSDADLNQLLAPIIEQSINQTPLTRLINSGVLKSLGLFNNSVLAYLINLGFTIV